MSRRLRERRERRSALYSRGVVDGLANRPATSLEAAYQIGWRQGRSDRAEIAELHLPTVRRREVWAPVIPGAPWHEGMGS